MAGLTGFAMEGVGPSDDGNVYMPSSGDPIHAKPKNTPTNTKKYSPAAFGDLIYPDDMQGSNFYPECIRFGILQRMGISIQEIGNVLADAYNHTKQSGARDIAVARGESANSAIPEKLRRKIERKLSTLGPEPTEKIRDVAMAETIDNWNQTNATDENGEVIVGEDGKPVKNPQISKDAFGFLKRAINRTGMQLRELQAGVAERANQPQNLKPKGSIYLNMPNGVQFNEAANWQGDALGFMGKTIHDFVGGTDDMGAGMKETALGALVGSAGNIAGGSVGGMAALASKMGLSGGMFGGALGAMAAGTPIQKGAEKALGIAQNPYMEMMFSGVGFRKFQFDFVLRPKSFNEIKTVQQILKVFRMHSKPSYTGGSLGKSFMDHPMEFSIEFLMQNPGGGSWLPNSNIPKIKNCVCDNVTTNYTPQSIWASYHAGHPVAVNLNLSFQETELVMAEDVRDKGY